MREKEADMWVPESDFANCLAREAVSQYLRQASDLHPKYSVAKRIVEEAVGYLLSVVLPHQQDREEKRRRVPHDIRPTKADLSLPQLFQFSIFEVSIPWEKDQEGPEPTRSPRYRPTPHVMLRRYVKHLVWFGFLWERSLPMALGFGSELYSFDADDIRGFMALEEPHDQPARRKLQHYIRTWSGKLQTSLVERFEHIGVFDDGRLHRSPPDGPETQVVEEAMADFTPCGVACFTDDLRPRLFAHLAQMSEAERKHAITCTVCAGVACLADQWRVKWPEAIRDVYEPRLEVPMFKPFDAPGPDNNDPVNPEQLEDLQCSLRDAWHSAQRRRWANAFHRLRVCVDGQERLQFVPGVRALPFTVPLSAIRIQIFGQDAEGELPLAVFYLPDLEEDDAEHQLYMVLDSGATISLAVAPVPSPSGDVPALQATLHFWADEALVPKTAAWYEAAVTAAQRSLELARATADSALEAVLQNRLHMLHREWTALEQAECRPATDRVAYEALEPQPVHQPTSADHPADLPGPGVCELGEVVSSPPWYVPWAGEPWAAGGSGSVSQEHEFQLGEGVIQVTCQWWAASQGQPATLWLEWQTDTVLPGDLWVRFTQRDDTSTILAERPLGQAFRGECSWWASELGFDPLHQPWALILLVKASQI